MSNQTEYDNNDNNLDSKGSSVNILLCIVIAALILVVIYDNVWGGKKIRTAFESIKKSVSSTFKNENALAVKSIDIEADSRASFAVIGKNIVQCTKDGIKFYNSSFESKWGDTFTMTSPIMTTEGEYIAVAELLGKNVRVYNTEGLVYNIQSDYSISRISLNSNGYVSIITKADDGYRVYVYNSSGNKITERVDQVTGYFPIASDVSDDNRVLVISYVDSTDILLNSRILFFYINENESKNWTNGMYNGVEKPGEIFPEVAFMGNNNLVAAGDSSVFSCNTENGKEEWSYVFTNNIEKLSLKNKNYIVYICGDEKKDFEGIERGTIQCLDLDGNVKDLGKFGSNMTYLNCFSNEIILGENHNFYCINYAGKLIWEHTASQDINDIIPLDKKDTTLYITNINAQIMEMSREEEKDDEENDEEENKQQNNDKGSQPDDLNEENSQPESQDSRNENTENNNENNPDEAVNNGTNET